MIIYNVTCHVDNEIVEEWIEWMRTVHLPEVMNTGKFLSYEFLKVQKHDLSDEGESFAIMYRSQSIEDYNNYVENYAPALKQKTMKKYGDRVMAFRTILESL